ncbi:alpha-2-macroglobulin-like protein 1 [Notothenia coriiceps]|uniref:Alpha-2-macroglobulin-like protein 1 n=1 Tax=Notothenia coriiceps TaxID=8208 RepID=A0A6I9PYF9_9TELE|nr:PREDICTED: alpha-2-macroglobulin-like protein 1 [Notothenia coriiceps]
MPKGELVADSMDFPIRLCLNNKVSLRFSSLQELPAEKTTLTLQAHPGSMCSVRAIDQSVLLLQKEQELTVDSVYSQLPVQKLSGYSYDLVDAESDPCKLLPVPEDEIEIIEPELELAPDVEPASRAKRSFYFPEDDQKNDVYNIFKGIGIKIVTNSDIRKPYDCHPVVYYTGMFYSLLLISILIDSRARNIIYCTLLQH